MRGKKKKKTLWDFLIVGSWLIEIGIEQKSRFLISWDWNQARVKIPKCSTLETLVFIELEPWSCLGLEMDFKHTQDLLKFL